MKNNISIKALMIMIIMVTFSQAYSQKNFKEVKTADDVMNNYITAIGGKDKIKNIRSETITGKFKLHGFEGNFLVYRNDSVYFTKVDGKEEGKEETLLQKSLITKNTGWEYQMGAMNDYEPDELAGKLEDNFTGSLFFYLNYKNEGYAAELKGTDTVNGKNCYKIVTSKSGETIRTNYYDSKTFLLLRSEKPNNFSLEFKDYKEVSGTLRPYTLIQNTNVEIEEDITMYEYNKEIDSALFSKPNNDK